MKRKFKLLLSIGVFILCVGLLVFGVYAANQVNYTSNGTIRYTVKDVFVEVHTKLFRSTDTAVKTQAELDATLTALENSNDFQTTATAQHLQDMNYGISGTTDNTELKTFTSNTISSPNTTMSKTLNDFALVYDEYAAANTYSFAYYIVITVQNSGNAAVGVTATTTVPASSNTLYNSTASKNVAASGTQNFVFATCLDDPRLAVNTTFNYSLSVSKQQIIAESVFRRHDAHLLKSVTDSKCPVAGNMSTMPAV